VNAPARITLVSDVSPVCAGGASRRDHVTALGVIALAALYATVRYNVFKGVPWGDWPGYIADKALAVAGLLLLALAGWRKFRGRGSGALLMSWAGVLVIGHVALSLALFPAGYFSRFITDGHATLAGGISLLAGGLAIGLLELGARRAAVWRNGGVAASFSGLLVFSAVHSAAPGVSGWLDPGTWPGGLPPLTLLASVPAFLTSGLLLMRVRAN